MQIGRTSVLNDDGKAASGFLGIFMTQKVLDSRDSTKPTKMIAEPENNCWKECKIRYSSINLLKDTLE